VKKFKYHSHNLTKYPVPQIGWNMIKKTNNSWDGSLLSYNTNGDFMYFVHSYYVEPKENGVILASTDYGDKQYCSAIKKENIFACQFHPEKSGEIGMNIYENLKRNTINNEKIRNIL